MIDAAIVNQCFLLPNIRDRQMLYTFRYDCTYFALGQWAKQFSRQSEEILFPLCTAVFSVELLLL